MAFKKYHSFQNYYNIIYRKNQHLPYIILIQIIVFGNMCKFAQGFFKKINICVVRYKQFCLRKYVNNI